MFGLILLKDVLHAERVLYYINNRKRSDIGSDRGSFESKFDSFVDEIVWL